MNSLKNIGSSAPLNQTNCFKHNSYWLNFWENCGDSIDANLLKGLNKEQIKKKHEYDRQISYESLELSGLNNFFGELNKVEILPNQVISFCFDKLVKCIERGNAKDNKFEGIKNLVMSSVKNIKEKEKNE